METTPNNETSNLPAYTATIRQQVGKNKATFERIGAAWVNEEKGSIYLKLHGTQIIEDGIYLFPNDDQPEA